MMEKIRRKLTFLGGGGVCAFCVCALCIFRYVQSFKSTLMNVSYSWSRGSSFSEICELTDLFEGSIIRAMRRLNELIMQLHSAAVAIGDEKLADKFQKAAQSIQRGIIFAASLYVEA